MKDNKLREVSVFEPDRVVALSTVDNPFNPIDDFEHWFVWDIKHQHNCCGILDLRAKTNRSMSEEEYMNEIERAIDEIVLKDKTNTYIKVVSE